MLKKLSLAALVAMGSMSVASATPLTEAIKGVSLNGFMRIRYYRDMVKDGKSKGHDDNYNRWQTNAKLVFGLPVAENAKIVWRVNAQTIDEEHSKTKNLSKSTLTDSLFFLNYANNGLIVNLGVVPLGALPYASSDEFTTAHGTGAVVMYNVGNGLILAAGGVDHIFNANGKLNGWLPLSEDTNLSKIGGSTKANPLNGGSKNIYTIGAIYSNDAFGNAQVWDYQVDDAIENAFLIMTNLNFLKDYKDYGIDIKADFATSKLDDDGIAKSLGLSKLEGVDNHNYYRIALAGTVSGFDAEIGYAGTNDKGGVIATSDDAKIGQIPVELRKNVANLTDVDTIYATVAYKLDEKTKVWVSYANIDQSKNQTGPIINQSNNIDSSEFDIEGSYKFNKKFAISGYYANLDYGSDAEKEGKHDQQEVRLQFKYSF